MNPPNGKWISIKLRPDTAAMVENVMRHDVFPSLSECFETALLVFQQHSDAVLTYVEQEEAKGRTRDEIFCLLKTDISFRRLNN